MAHAQSPWVPTLRQPQSARSSSRRHALQSLAITCLFILAGCASAPTHPTTPSGILPHFSDWRAAYLAPDGRAHIVTQDGKTDLIGPALPDLTSNALIFSNAGMAPDGKLLAYAPSTLDFIDVTGNIPPRSLLLKDVGLDRMMWSPDGSRLLSYAGPGQFSYITLSTGHATPLTPGQDILDYLGWIDNAHIATVSYQGATYGHDDLGDSAPTSAKLDSLDLTSGQIRTLATIEGDGPTLFQFALSPDGSRVLYYDARWRDFPFIPQAGVVNLATGNVTPLPTIAQMTGSDFTSVTWRPGTEQVAVTTQVGDNRNGKFWLLDTQRDTATMLGSGMCALAWSPDGKSLALSNAFNGPNDEIGEGPNELSLMRFGPDGQTSTTVLTQKAMSFPIIGFVRNP